MDTRSSTRLRAEGVAAAPAALAATRERVTGRDSPAAARALGLPDDEGNLSGTYTAKLPGKGGEA